MWVCSNCGRLLVGQGDFCPYCGFPRPKLTQQLEDTGTVPRVRPPKRAVDWPRLGKRIGITAGVVAVAIAVIVGVNVLLNRTSAEDSVMAARGTIPAQESAPKESWTTPSSELFPALGKATSTRFYEPGRFDEKYASHVLVAGSNSDGESQLVSLNVNDGSVRWRITAATPFSCSDRPISGSIACLYDSQLRVLALDDGAVARTLPVHVTSREIAVVGETVLAISGRAKGNGESVVNVQAFAQDATMLWSSEQTVKGTSFGLSTVGGLAAVTGVTLAENGSPVVFRVSDGKRVELPAGTATLLRGDKVAVTKDGKSSVCSDNGQCKDPVEGTPVRPSVYDSDVADFPFTTLVVKGDTRTMKVYTDGGDVSWERAVTDPTTVGFCAGKVILRDKSSIRALAPDDGSEAWSTDAIPETVGMWCDPERVMTYTDASTLKAMMIEDGSQAWTVDFPDGARPNFTATTAGLIASGDTWARYK